MSDISVPIAEAAFIAGVSDRDMNRAIDEHILPGALTRNDDGRRLARLAAALAGFYFTSEDVYAAGLRRRVLEEVTNKVHARKDTDSILALRSSSIEKMDWQIKVPDMSIGTVSVDVGSFVLRASVRVGSIEKAHELITTDPAILGGIPTIRGTRVPVDSVSSSLIKGIARERVLGAHPSLTHEHLDAAVIYADIHPRPGRPHKVSRVPSSWKVKSIRHVPSGPTGK
jgi:uncharacterized protein (DUF433 family)